MNKLSVFVTLKYSIYAESAKHGPENEWNGHKILQINVSHLWPKIFDGDSRQ